MASPLPAHAINLEHFRYSASRAEREPSTTLARMGARLALEASAARLVGRLSRAAGRGGGTTLPGQARLEARPGRRRRPRRAAPPGGRPRLGDERQDDHDRDGERDPRTHADARLEQLGGEPRLGHRLHAAGRGRRRSRPARGRRVRPAGADAPDAPACRVPRQPLPRPARPLRRARAHRRALARCRRRARSGGHARRERGRSARRGACRGPSEHAALRRRRPSTRAHRPPARLRLEVLHSLRSSVPLRRGLRRPSRRVSLRGVRPRTAAARRRRARDRAGRPRRRFLRAARAGTEACAFVWPFPASTTCTTRSRPPRSALSLGVALDDVVAGLERFRAAFGRFERFSVGDRGFLLLLVKNPAGANEALRTLEEGGVPPFSSWRSTIGSPTGAMCPGSGTSTSSPCSRAPNASWSSGERAAELALRFTYAGFPRERLELVSDLQAALDRGLELTPTGGELAVLPTYTAMLELRAIATERGLTRPYWERDGR